MIRFQTTWKHIRRSPYQAILVVLVTSLTFFVTGMFIYAALASSALLRYFEKKPQITAFFSDRMSEKNVEKLVNKLESTGKIASLRYVSKDEALKIYREQNKSDPLLLEMVTADILPASLEIQTKDAKYLTQIALVLKDEKDIDEVVYQKDIVDTLLTWTNTVRTAGIVLIIFFTLLSILVMLTITGVKIIFRRDEVEIMKLVGATNRYVSWPFFLENMFYGLIGSFIGWIMTYLILLYTTPLFSSLFSGISDLKIHLNDYLPMAGLSFTMTVWPVSVSLMFALLAFMTLIGILLGIVGSSIALGRYLRQ